jgi:hypothetical protein
MILDDRGAGVFSARMSVTEMSGKKGVFIPGTVLVGVLKSRNIIHWTNLRSADNRS